MKAAGQVLAGGVPDVDSSGLGPRESMRRESLEAWRDRMAAKADRARRAREVAARQRADREEAARRAAAAVKVRTPAPPARPAAVPVVQHGPAAPVSLPASAPRLGPVSSGAGAGGRGRMASASRPTRQPAGPTGDGRARRGSLDRDRLVAEYVAGESAVALATRYGVSSAWVHKVIAEAGVPRHAPHGRVPRDEVVAAYQAGRSVAELAAAHSCSQHRVREVLHEAGVPLRPARGNPTPPSPAPRALSPEQADRVAAAYVAGAAVADMAAEYGVSSATVYRVLRDRTVPARGPEVGPRGVADPQHAARLVAEYAAGETVPGLAARYGHNRATVRDWIARAGVPRRDDRTTHSGGCVKPIGAYPDDLVAAVVDAYQAGDTIREVAGSVPGARSPKQVRAILLKAGVTLRPSASAMSARGDTALVMARVDALLAAGWTHARIGDELGVSQTTVSRWCRRRAGLTDADAEPSLVTVQAELDQHHARTDIPAPAPTPAPVAEPSSTPGPAPDPELVEADPVPGLADALAQANRVVSDLLDAAAALAGASSHVAGLVLAVRELTTALHPLREDAA